MADLRDVYDRLTLIESEIAHFQKARELGEATDAEVRALIRERTALERTLLKLPQRSPPRRRATRR